MSYKFSMFDTFSVAFSADIHKESCKAGFHHRNFLLHKKAAQSAKNCAVFVFHIFTFNVLPGNTELQGFQAADFPACFGRW